MTVLIDNRGYVNSYNTIEGSVDDGWIRVDEPKDFENFEARFFSYKIQNGVLVYDEDEFIRVSQTNLSNEIRRRREAECFKLIDRSKFWYDSLTEAQTNELKAWYEAWLDATETLVIPNKPDWL